MKKSQAAMEFLMTYGWAILVVLGAISALSYFGVLSPDKLLPDKCTLPQGLGCLEFAFNSDLTELEMVISNGLGMDLEDFYVLFYGSVYIVEDIKDTAGNSLPDPVMENIGFSQNARILPVFRNGETYVFQLKRLDDTIPAEKNAGEVDVIAMKRSGLEYKKTGSLKSKVYSDGGFGCAEGFERDCGSDIGLCQHGTQTCTDGVWGPCLNFIGPENEVCTDSEDNDCDGDTDCEDEDCDGEQGGDPNQICEYLTELTCNDGFDNDADGYVDCDAGNEDSDCVCEVCTDNDGDLYGNPASVECDHPELDCADVEAHCSGYSGDALTFCQSNLGLINPGATELCNGVDDDCTNGIDDGIEQDGCELACIAYGNEWLTSFCCGDDENEADPYEVTESSCSDGHDNDCDGYIDCEGDGDPDCSCGPGCTDSDGDGYGNPGDVSCANPEEDCVDTTDHCLAYSGDALLYCQGNLDQIHPGATELCNGVDDDCDTEIDEGFDEDDCEAVCVASGFVWTGTLCCGDDNYEADPYLEEEKVDPYCKDGNDNDCDGNTDCDDDGCNGYNCTDDGSACTMDICSALYCEHIAYGEGAQPLGCDNNGGCEGETCECDDSGNCEAIRVLTFTVQACYNYGADPRVWDYTCSFSIPRTTVGNDNPGTNYDYITTGTNYFSLNNVEACRQLSSLNEIQDKKAILSTYPNNFDPSTNDQLYVYLTGTKCNAHSGSK